MALPARCDECQFFDSKLPRCLRHAPGTAFEALEIAAWSGVSPEDRCGSGEKAAEGAEPLVSCGHCLHWHQPGGLPLKPEWKQNLPDEWWRDTGFCTRFAPSAGAGDARRARWHVTHGTSRCGDGEPVRNRT